MASRTRSIIDLPAKPTMFRGRTSQSTMADREGSGARLAAYRDRAGDELIHVIDGAATLDIVGENGRHFFTLRAGTVAVMPQGAWHRSHSPEGVTLMTATPSPSDIVELEGEDREQWSADRHRR